jgi:phospholipid/cholesterol/gamma-HCH transport system substrate-binding protein
MAKKASRMMIGGFVVFAVIIMAASLVVFGSGKFFQKTMKFVLYFDGSVKGLSVGAPVLFQGVRVGSVTSIVIQADLVNLQANIPVIIAIDPSEFQIIRGEIDPRKNVPRLIKNGLRAVLGMQSFITGQLEVELDFYPGTPIVLKHINKEYPEIPTTPSTTQKLADALAKLDLKKLEDHLESAMDGIAKLANNPDLPASIQGLKETLQSAHKLVVKVDRQVDPMAKGTKKTVTDLGNLARNLNDRVGGVTTGLDKTMSSARSVLSEDSPLIVDLQNTLKEISAASRSLRQLSDYLEQHPESLIRGKVKPGSKSGGK